MGHYLFILKHCPRCGPMEEAVLDINRQLTVSQRIEIIDIYGGDPRVELLRRRYGGHITMAPVLVINYPIVKKVFNSYVKGFERVIIDSVHSVEHAKVLLKKLIYYPNELGLRS